MENKSRTVGLICGTALAAARSYWPARRWEHIRHRAGHDDDAHVARRQTTLKPLKSSAYSRPHACIKQATAMKRPARSRCHRGLQGGVSQLLSPTACTRKRGRVRNQLRNGEDVLRDPGSRRKDVLKTCKRSEKVAVASCQLTDPNCVEQRRRDLPDMQKACAQSPAWCVHTFAPA